MLHNNIPCTQLTVITRVKLISNILSYHPTRSFVREANAPQAQAGRDDQRDSRQSPCRACPSLQLHWSTIIPRGDTPRSM